MLLQLNLLYARAMKDEEFDFDIENYLSELEEIERELDKEIQALYPDDAELDYEPYDYMDYFKLLENEIPENRSGIYDWLEEWFHTFFGENLNGNDAYVLYSGRSVFLLKEQPWKDTTIHQANLKQIRII